MIIFFIIKAIKNVIIIMFIHCNFYKLNNIKTVQLTLQINLQEQTFPGINEQPSNFSLSRSHLKSSLLFAMHVLC